MRVTIVRSAMGADELLEITPETPEEERKLYTFSHMAARKASSVYTINPLRCEAIVIQFHEIEGAISAKDDKKKKKRKSK